MKIDSHQHFWKYDSIKDSWITDEMGVLKANFSPNQLGPLLQLHDFDGCIAVQADQSEQETEFLVNLANDNRFVKGVVGWVDLQADTIQDKLDYFSSFQIIKGFRHIVQAEPFGFLLTKKFMRGTSYLKNFNFTYDILIREHQLPNALDFVRYFPKQKFVIDHLAKPAIKEKHINHWKKDIATFAAYENVYCKLSGLVTEGDWQHWKADDFTPYLDQAIITFGTKRVMYGSDWPVCLVAASYDRQLSLLTDYFSSFTTTEQEDIFGNNAARFYNL